MSRSTITSKGQTIVPLEIRKYLDLKPGDKIEFVIHPDGSVRDRPITIDLQGAW